MLYALRPSDWFTTSSPDYVWQKCCEALDAIEKHPSNLEYGLGFAYSNYLLHLESNDANAEIAEELSVVLLICKKYFNNQTRCMNAMPESEEKRVRDKLQWIVKTSDPTR